MRPMALVRGPFGFLPKSNVKFGKGVLGSRKSVSASDMNADGNKGLFILYLVCVPAVNCSPKGPNTLFIGVPVSGSTSVL